MFFFRRPDPFRLLRNLVIGVNQVALNLADLTAAVADLKTSVGTVSTALDDVAAKLAAASGSDPAAQAVIDRAVTDIKAQSAALGAVAAKDDPQPSA